MGPTAAPVGLVRASIDSEPEQLRRLRPALLSTQELSVLSAKRPSTALALIVIDVLLIVASALTAEAVGSLGAYVVAVIFIGARQIGIATVAMHDAGVHGSMFRSAEHNQKFCQFWSWLLFVPVVGVTCESFRQSHYGHHQTVNTTEDTDRETILAIYGMTRPQRALSFLFVLSGAAFIQGLYFLIKLGSWQIRLFYGVTAAALVLYVLVDFWPLSAVVKYWILPIATWGMFVNFVRAAGEHFPHHSPDYVDGKFRTREVAPSWFDKFFVTTRSINFHLTHHLYPSIPFFRLAKTHRILMGRQDYTERVLVVRGYHNVLHTMLTMRQVPECELYET